MYNYKNSLNESSYKSYEGNADIIEKLGGMVYVVY